MREFTNGEWEYAKGRVSTQRTRDYTKDIRVHKGHASTQREIESKRRSSRARGYTNWHASTQRVREYTNGAYECTKGRASALVALIPPFPSNAN